MHDFFYEQSNYKVGASENNMQLDIKVTKKELSNKNFLENTSEEHPSLKNKKFRSFKKLTKKNLKFNLTKKIIYFTSIFGFLFILGFLLFFISQSKKMNQTLQINHLNQKKDF